MHGLSSAVALPHAVDLHRDSVMFARLVPGTRVSIVETAAGHIKLLRWHCLGTSFESPLVVSQTSFPTPTRDR